MQSIAWDGWGAPKIAIYCIDCSFNTQAFPVQCKGSAGEGGGGGYTKIYMDNSLSKIPAIVFTYWLVNY